MQPAHARTEPRLEPRLEEGDEGEGERTLQQLKRHELDRATAQVRAVARTAGELFLS